MAGQCDGQGMHRNGISREEGTQEFPDSRHFLGVLLHFPDLSSWIQGWTQPWLKSLGTKPSRNTPKTSQDRSDNFGTQQKRESGLPKLQQILPSLAAGLGSTESSSQRSPPEGEIGIFCLPWGAQEHRNPFQNLLSSLWARSKGRWR